MSYGYRFGREPERSLEPVDPEVDGEIRCCECEEIIPGDDWYFEVDGKYFCEACMNEHKHSAPYKGEWF